MDDYENDSLGGAGVKLREIDLANIILGYGKNRSESEPYYTENDPVLLHVASSYVTPEMFGAKGDGVNDDGPALQRALESGKKVLLTKDLYVFSKIVIYDHNVYLDGNEHTVYVDLINESIGWDNPFAIVFGVHPNPDGVEGPLKVISGSYRESIGEHRGIGVYGDSYTYGYISYKECIPVPSWFTDILDADEGATTTYYNAYKANIRNIEFRYSNCTGKFGLRLAFMVESVLYNVRCIVEEGHDGMTGISINGCSDVTVDRCFCENWTHIMGWRQMGTHGYGISLGGDNIKVTRFHGINNRDHISGGGDIGKFWASRCFVNDAVLESDCSRWWDNPNTPKLYFDDGFECHGHAYMFTYENVKLIKTNQGNNTYRGYLFGIRTKYATVRNIEIEGQGVMCFPSEFTEVSYLSHIIAPGGVLRGYHGEDWQKLTFGREVVVSDSVFDRVESFICSTTLKMVNCVVYKRIWEVSHLVMVNSVVYGDQDWLVLSPIEVYEDAQIVNCDLYHNGSTFTKSDTPLIKAPENSVQMMNCRCRVLPGGNVFTNQQNYAVNNTVQHRFGLILTSEESLLDKYYPFP